MLQHHYRGDAAGAITTASETLDAAIEDAQTQREALQAQRDALQKQISELWAQDDELDEAIGEAAAEIGGGGVTVQVYSRDRSRRRAEGDEDIRRQLEELNRKKGEIILEMNDIENKYRFDSTDTVRAVLDRYDRLEEENDELNEQMQELIDSAEGEINWNDYEHM